MTFSQKILDWYALNKRSLPWRSTVNPYKIWLSEIMLQQTRVAQGTSYYLSFEKHFPTIFDLANASEEKVLKLWQGLGYYSRARNLHFTAKHIVNNLNGEFPNTYKELVKLKGVGDYTASAIASISFNEQQAVVDGNVYRVLSRYYGIDLPINSTEGVKYFKTLATEVMHSSNIRDYNQGIMEFGAIQCVPKNPDCKICPLNDSCVALEKNLIATLPVKLKKIKVKKRNFNYLVVVDAVGNTLLQQRTGKGIWQNLYQFPLLEEEVNEDAILELYNKVLPKIDVNSVTLYNKVAIVHKLSHQHLHTHFWVLHTDAVLEEGIPFSELEKYPVPVLIADYIKTL
ncbi:MULTISPECIES: A/G-specific adenine glycosylase [unclassified Cellulophaga]|uniref:A/G-specific adenine glycosylase n=1 Tax=unclassified Cellulophaga TaxID=2634405 RepID=UPI0026E21033|nr:MULTISPECIES: A/G-specific adenine glycosylase [unclassified Cellulophaga]MDO6492831.1 A/G-specific adenine glycosylase [Cellulophaga sp. 2_MG-2023]MDO6496333.1 A/G-specific adenine glycosylase [Cellulophaga sp. 3_MG-2023]